LLFILRSWFRFSLTVGESMLPTLAPGDWLVVNLRAYQAANPRRGDIVVASHRSGFVVKRVVALPGEEVEVRRGGLFINGAPVAEDYRTHAGYLDIGKGRLAAGRFALLGDNRAVTREQSVHAIVGKEQIMGRVDWTFRLWPGPRHEESEGASPLGRIQFAGGN
jgi:signal peptidase I